MNPSILVLGLSFFFFQKCFPCNFVTDSQMCVMTFYCFIVDLLALCRVSLCFSFRLTRKNL